MNKNCTIELILTDKELADKDKNLKSFTIKVDSTDESLLYNNIMKWLKDPKNIGDKHDLISYISDKLSITGKIKVPKVSELIKMTHLQGNSTVDAISNMYGIQAPEISNPGRFNILLIDGLFKRNGIHVSGRRVINSTGEELFILNGSKRSDIHLFFNYLKVREKIELFNFADDLDFKSLVDAYTKYNKNKKKSIKIDENTSIEQLKILVKEMLLDFLNNKDMYAGSKVLVKKDNEETIRIFELLDSTVRNIFEVPFRVKYNDPFIDFVNYRIIYTNLSSKNGMLASINLNSMFEGLNNNFKEIIDLFKIKKTSFNTLFKINFKLKLLESLKDYIIEKSKELNKGELSEEEILKRIPDLFENKVIGDIILQLLNSDNPTFIDLINNLFKTNKEFPLLIDKFENNSLYFKWANYTLYEKYGITYNTIELMSNPESYLGYNIYNQTINNDDGTASLYFYISRGYLDPKLKEKRYLSLEEAKLEIENKILNQNISDNSLIEFNYREENEDYNKRSIFTKTRLAPKTIINVIDIPVKELNYSEVSEDEIKIILGNAKMLDFLNLVSNWNISDELKLNIANEINTPEKVVIFLHKLNEELKQDRTDENVINSIVSLILSNSEKTRSYYIERSINTISGPIYYIIPTVATLVIKTTEKSKSYNVPIQTYLQIVKKLFDTMFGNKVKVELLTSSEIKELGLLTSEEINSTKAFIRNGVIYINTTNATSSDLVHEYLHLILGTLKTDETLRSNYENLIYTYTSNNISDFEKFKERNLYKELSQIDLMEEFFVKNFSNWLMNKRGNKEDSEIFRQVEEITELGVNSSNIFSESISIADGFFNKKIDIFTRLSHDIAELLDKGTDWSFGDTIKTRKYSNWVNKLILDKQIKEECK